MASELELPPEAAGERLDVLLAQTLGSRSRAQRLIVAGRVLVDGAKVRKNHRVGGGERVVLDDTPEGGQEPDQTAPTAPVAAFGIAWEDEHLLVVDKPAGVVVHPARGHREGTLAQALLGRAAGGEEPWRAGIVHRLDRNTSGLLVVAKDDAVHRTLKSAMAAREIRREYLALVEGRPPARSGTIEAPIGRDRRQRTLMSVGSVADALKDAITHFEIERALPRATLLRVRLQTGRTHQIRVHMRAIGHPVCGDPEYGHAGLFGLQRQFLHAARLAFSHPVSGEPIDVSSPLPGDLQAALDQAARQGSRAIDD
ncbi:MAG: Ribosomal large subunit pseudouridine synthase D [uncultured Solirubrobacteraceae bacterium]|uniref:Pseudouridine synthase n=1 Tax=uncultured Solirubrobacteraceae bacterium TaxID=1162706 RepID=A0A6J4S8M0_9ACTN|nr:MAG: Ribosomal large subunit pseudouridine synthase D [uncultured Solirubrobacteraceae bacterium]